MLVSYVVEYLDRANYPPFDGGDAWRTV